SAGVDHPARADARGGCARIARPPRAPDRRCRASGHRCALRSPSAGGRARSRRCRPRGGGRRRAARPRAGRAAPLLAARRPAVQLAQERAEPLFSWRPIAMRIASERPGGARVFFRASDEYQLCGGLAYYLGGQRLDLLMPPGWMAPTFLGGRVERLFTGHDAFEAAWHAGGTFLVSDAVGPPGAEASLVPGPYAVVDRAGSKVLLRAVGPRDGALPGPAGRFSPAPFTEGALGTSIPAAAPVAGARP